MDVAFNTLFTSTYVGSLFVLPSARTWGSPPRLDPATGRPQTRDTPHVIRTRLAGVGVSSLISLGVAGAIIVNKRSGRSSSLTSDVLSAAHQLGLYKPGITFQQAAKLAVYPLACTASLFLGPLYTLALDGRLPAMGAWSWRLDVASVFKSLRGMRNYIVGPITEELVFRSCIMATAALYGRSRRYLIFATPLYFGIAHAHHAWEVYVNGGKTRQSLQRGIFSSLFQLAYTSLFGFHAAFLFLRTGSVLPPVLSHMFCNLMGFPHPAEAVQRRPSQKYAIAAVYVAGIAAFVKSLRPLTDPSHFGGSLFW